MIIISDTSPITNLAAIGQLDLLRQLYSRVIISQAVYKLRRSNRRGAIMLLLLLSE